MTQVQERTINGILVSINDNGLFFDGEQELTADTTKRIESCTITFHESIGDSRKAFRMIYWIDHEATTLGWFDNLEKIYNLISSINELQ